MTKPPIGLITNAPPNITKDFIKFELSSSFSDAGKKTCAIISEKKPNNAKSYHYTVTFA